MDEPRRSTWQRAWPVVKWSLFALVVVFVWRRAHDLWDPAAFDSADWRPGWLLPAVLVYLVGWIPSVWFWRTMLRRLGANVSGADAVRAHYCGHLGKYVPGKALALVIRAGLLRDRGARPAVAGLTAAYETLAMMAVGAALGAALAPSVLPASFWENAHPGIGWLWSIAAFRWLWTTPAALPILVAAVSAALLPILARVASIAARKMAPTDDTASSPDDTRRAIGTRDFATGMLVLVIAWWIQGLSLGCVVTAVSGRPFDLANWPAWTAAVSLATSVGFVAIFAPGGVGVREWVLLEVLRLQPGITPEAAVAAAVLLRLVWLFAELAAAAVLYWGMAPSAPSLGPGTRTAGMSNEE